MTLNEYIEHYINLKEMLTFLTYALAALIMCICIILLCASLISHTMTGSNKKLFFYNKSTNLIERFYEMIFSGTSILSFLSTYYLIDRFVTNGAFRTFWDAHKDMLLLVMIILSCVFNSFLDKIFVSLKNLDKDEKSSVRLTGMLYIIMIFIYIKYIYENNNYDGFIAYFLGLIVGRFAYFDSSFKDFIKSIKNASKNLPLLLLGLSYTGFMCYIGFTGKYLLKSNGVLVSTFFAHIFMVIAIFIINKSRLLNLVIKKPATQNNDTQSETSD